MANPKWFDDNVYMTNKLAQLKATDADTYGSWDMYQLENAFTEAGFGGAEGAYAHFNEYGNSKDENISPNANFIPSQYYVFKAAALYHDGDVNAVTSVESAYVASAIKDAGMSAWQHYIDFGTKEGINPSNNFDTAKYLQAKADALNAQAGTTEWTADKVADAFKAANMNALSHAMQYADGSAGEAAAAFGSDGKPTGAYAVDNKISGGDAGQTFTLTQDIDDFTGTDGDDVFIGNLGAARVTIQSGDKINGGEGEDTFEIYGGFGTMPSNISSVEVFKIDESAAALNLSQYTKASTGLEKVVVNNASALNGTVTTSDGQSLSLSTGATNLKTAGAVTWAAGTTDTSATLTLNGYQGKATLSTPAAATDATNFNITGAKLETMNIESTGAANKVDTLNMAATTKNLVLTGDQNFTARDVQAGGAYTGLTSIDASNAEGNVTLTVGGVTGSTFTYAGSKGNDKLTISAGEMAALGAGTQLAGGEGDNDILITQDVTANLTDPVLAKFAATTGFEALGFGGAAATQVDASKLSSATFAKHFVDSATGNLTLNNVQSGTMVDVLDGTGNLVINGDRNATSITVNMGDSTTANVAGGNTTFSNAITNITVTSNGTGVAGNANNMGTVTAAAGATLDISGSEALSLTMAAAGKVDAADLSGNLTVGNVNTATVALTTGLIAGNSAVITGTGNNTVCVGADQTADGLQALVTLGSGSGNDVIAVNGTAGLLATNSATNMLVINNFEAGKDHLYIGVGNASAAGIGTATTMGLGANVTVNAKGVITAGYSTLAEFLAGMKAATLATAAVGDAVVWTDGTNSYVASANAANTVGNVTVVELAGVVATELVDAGDYFTIS